MNIQENQQMSLFRNQIRQVDNASEANENTTDNRSQQSQQQTSITLFIFFSYLYFVQGAIIGIAGTMPYIYKELPDVHTMALFHAVTLPYSLKFLLAPFLQKHSSIQYGKRKTWIIISQLLTGVTLFIGSFYTKLEEAHLFAVLCIIMMVGMVLQNIALHSLIVKQITNAHKSSMIQSWSQVFGILIGGLILLKLTSQDFATLIELSEPITTPKVVFICFSVLILIPLLIIHFNFQQKTLESERRGTRFTFCQILSYYGLFKEANTKYFRFGVLAIIHNQGLNFFNSLYEYQLVKAGFSRDTMNTIGNIIIIPIIVLTFWFSNWTTSIGGSYQAVIFTTFVILILSIYILLFFPLSPWIFAVYNFITSLLDAWRFFVFMVVINQFPLHALSGMYITLLGSFYNFAYLKFIHTELCGYLGWRLMSWLGLGLELLIIYYMKPMWIWMEEGSTQVAKEIQDPSTEQNLHEQMQEIPAPFH